MEEADELGVVIDADDDAPEARSDLAQVNARVKGLALAQSADIERRLTRDGVAWCGDEAVGRVPGRARRRGGGRPRRRRRGDVEADAVLVATGARRAPCRPRSPTASGS